MKDKKDVTVSVVIPDSMRDLIVDMAGRGERTISGQVRIILNEGMKMLIRQEHDSEIRSRMQAVVK